MSCNLLGAGKLSVQGVKGELVQGLEESRPDRPKCGE
jgi:hypothetical protein